jgi:predicted O-methyltransferase YrrM
MPEVEGMALYEAGLRAGKVGPLLEIGSYCGKSAVYLGASARERNTVLYSVDHHRGSEEHQPGQEFHDPRLLDPDTGAIDTLPHWRRTIAAAGLEDVVIGVVGESAAVARNWGTPLGLLFVDGGHSEEAAQTDLASWASQILPGGLLAIHDVNEEDPAWGKAPAHIFRAALASGEFRELSEERTLRILERV